MKKTGSFIVIILFAVHALGFYAYFILRLSEIHSSAKYKLASLPAEQLDVLTIPAKFFRDEWLSEMELEWNKKMYDIARVEFKDGIATVYALHDEDEDRLLSLLDTVFRTSQKDQQPVPPAVVQFITLIFIPPVNTFCLHALCSDRTVIPYQDRLANSYFSVASPPPRG